MFHISFIIFLSLFNFIFFHILNQFRLFLHCTSHRGNWFHRFGLGQVLTLGFNGKKIGHNCSTST